MAIIPCYVTYNILIHTALLAASVSLPCNQGHVKLNFEPTAKQESAVYVVLMRLYFRIKIIFAQFLSLTLIAQFQNRILVRWCG